MRYFQLIFNACSGSGVALLLDRDTKPTIIIIPLILNGIGVGCIFQPILVALQAHTPKLRRAVIISNRNLFRSAGGASGLAISAAVLQARLRATLPSSYSYLASSTYALPESAKNISGVLDAYMAGSHAVFILQVPLISLCLLGTALIRDRGLEPPEDTVSGDPPISIQLEEEGASEPSTRPYNTSPRSRKGVSEDLELQLMTSAIDRDEDRRV